MSLRELVLDWLKSSNYMIELKEYISLPSRSRKSEEVKKTANYVLKLLQNSGLNAQIFETTGNPLVYGELIADESLPTILIYGHYDVQPEGEISKWNTPPFEATLIGNKLFGRGTADNKGQHYAHLLALRYLKENEPEILEKVNIKLLLDGDEELGSYSLPDFIKSHTEMLKADFVYVSDGPSLVDDAPTIDGAVRGITFFEIKIKHNQGDLHSGNFGGVARSATLDLISLLSTMVDNTGKVLLKDFYDEVEHPSAVEMVALKKLTPFYKKLIEQGGITSAINTDGHSNEFLNEMWPTLNINGIFAGGVGDQARTIIPSEAIASIDCRLVPNQNSVSIENILKSHIKEWAEKNGIEDAVSVEFGHGMDPTVSSINSPFADVVIKSVREGFGKEPIIVPRLVGSLPIALFPKYLNVAVIGVPYALPDENNHAPNENLDIPFFESGVVTTIALIRNLEY